MTMHGKVQYHVTINVTFTVPHISQFDSDRHYDISQNLSYCSANVGSRAYTLVTVSIARQATTGSFTINLNKYSRSICHLHFSRIECNANEENCLIKVYIYQPNKHIDNDSPLTVYTLLIGLI